MPAPGNLLTTPLVTPPKGEHRISKEGEERTPRKGKKGKVVFPPAKKITYRLKKNEKHHHNWERRFLYK